MSTDEQDPLRRIASDTAKRYRARFEEHGVSPRSLGWGSVRDQDIRFTAATQLFDFSGKTVLDFGCGFGDFLGFLEENGMAPEHYIGVDLNPDFIEVAAREHPGGTFICNSGQSGLSYTEQVDVTVMLGLMNFKQRHVDNLTYAKHYLGLAWRSSREALIVDFLSEIKESDYGAEDWVRYYSFGEVGRLCADLSPEFVVKHDYPPNPQREMMALVRKPRQ